MPRSRIDLLLDRIRFTYVPAVKDRAFFADLQGQLYDILSSVAAVPLRDSATVFEKQLQRQLSGLLDSISSVFDGTSVMRLPDNLREIFESLEISSDGIPLSRRGDGIKIRHITMLLNFISKKQDEILNRGGIRYTHLWGFEEPENSVEMAACFKMAENLVGFIQEAENYQLFLTTHSPVFYRINTLKGCSDYNTIYIEKDDGNQTKASIKKDTIVDKVMGLMPLVSPFVAAEKLRFDSLQKQFSQIKELASKNKPTIFVEGITDAKILRKAFSIFAPEKMDLLHITEGDDEADYGSAAAVSSRALAWVLEMRHRAISDRTKALALFDADDAGAFERKKLIENINQLAIKTAGMLSVKSLPIPPFAAFLRKSGFAIPVALESFYSEEIWAHAKSENWLEEIADPGSLLSKELVNNLIANKGSPFESLSEIDRLRLKYSFKKEKKETVALYVIHSKRNKTVDFIQGMRQIVEIIVKEISI